MSEYDLRAAALQRGVRYDEMENLEKGLDQYEEATVRQAIVHTRVDLVMVISQLSSANTQLATIRRLAWVAVVALCAIAYRVLS